MFGGKEGTLFERIGLDVKIWTFYSACELYIVYFVYCILYAIDHGGDFANYATLVR